jgi:hypothetical protein
MVSCVIAEQARGAGQHRDQRAFVRLRQILSTNKVLVEKFAELERRVEGTDGGRLDLFVDEDAQNDPDKSEKIHLKCKPDRECQEPQVDGDGRGQPGTDGLGKDVLNNAGGRNGQQNFAEESPEHTPD